MDNDLNRSLGQNDVHFNFLRFALLAAVHVIEHSGQDGGGSEVRPQHSSGVPEAFQRIEGKPTSSNSDGSSWISIMQLHAWISVRWKYLGTARNLNSIRKAANYLSSEKAKCLQLDDRGAANRYASGSNKEIRLRELVNEASALSKSIQNVLNELKLAGIEPEDQGSDVA